MKTHKLMIKSHNITGLKYLCYTRSEGAQYTTYKGSGKRWKEHLKKHGADISTELIYETACKKDFVKKATEISLHYNVVEDSNWANLKHETGDGGDTVSNRMWINNGETTKYHFKNEPIPSGWKKGRLNCVFNNKQFQAELRSRQDPNKKSEAMRKAWKDGKMDKRDHTKCGRSGDLNPAKRPEVRKKIQEAALSQSKERSERMKTNKVWEYSSRGHVSKY